MAEGEEDKFKIYEAIYKQKYIDWSEVGENNVIVSKTSEDSITQAEELIGSYEVNVLLDSNTQVLKSGKTYDIHPWPFRRLEHEGSVIVAKENVDMQTKLH